MYQYPYGDLQQLNLDWILNKIKELENEVNADILTEIANALIALSFDSSKVYKYGNIVFNPNDKKLYIMNSYSYPAGGSVWNDAYWDECLIGDVLYSIIKKGYATLLSTNDNTDRTTDITNQLNAFGICVLGAGYFYVSGLIVGSNNTLKGVSSDSVVRLIDGANKTAIILSGESTLENLTIIGADSNITPSATIGNRFGVEWSDALELNSVIHNCRIKRFTGAGIILKDTGTPVDKGLMISDCYITNNSCGIYIQKDSEYNKITNCIVARNYYGILNRGGNNIVANCGFDSNHINAQVDNDEGSNNGHGSFVGCTFNHAGGNVGDSITIKGTGRMLIAACNFYYGNINLTNTDGNVFTGCGFGSTTPINLTNNGCDLFVGCMFRSDTDSPVVITGTSDTQFVGCFYRNGTPMLSCLSDFAYLGNNTNRLITIPNGTDYDNLTTAGTYFCPTAAHALTMTHAPCGTQGVAHKLIVVSYPTLQTITQIALLNYGTSGVMTRTKSSASNWSNWHYIVPIHIIADTVSAGTGDQIKSHNTMLAGSRIYNVQFFPPENVGSDVTLTPADGSVTINGTFFDTTTVDYYFD